MKAKTWFAVVTCLLLAAVGAIAQQAFYGSIVGNVTDQSGAAVPGAVVIVANVLTGVNIEVKSSEAGIYQALNLTLGTYRVKVSAPGFQTMLRDNVIVGGGQQVRIDVQLTVGAVDQTVEVTGVSPQINTESATTTMTPITTHNIFTLPASAAIAEWPDSYNGLLNGYADVNNAAFSIGGTLSSQNAEVQDGMRIEGQSNYVGGNRGLARPSIDSVEELVITTATPSAKYPQPAAIEMVLKGGTNDYHGTMWFDHGNDLFNAKGYFSHVKNPYKIAHWGGSLGGPIKKEKTFFLFSYQAFRYLYAAEFYSSTPTAKMRAGDLSDFLTKGYAGLPRSYQLVDPLTGVAFENNQIPDARIDPIAKKFLSYYPAGPNRDEGLGFKRNFLNIRHGQRREQNWDARLDHYWKPTEHSYVRWSRFHSPNGSDQTILPGFGANSFTMKAHTITAHHTSTLRPNLVNHVMFGLFRENDPLGSAIGTTEAEAKAYVTELGIQGVPSTQLTGMPYFTFSQTGLTQPYTWAFTNFFDRFIHVRDDVSWTKGRHNIQVGFEYRRGTKGSSTVGGGAQINGTSCVFGCLNFTGKWTGLDFADFLLGYPFDTRRYTLLQPDFRNRNEWGGFLQDDLKVNSRLNVSIGLRYDFFPVATSVHGYASMFDPYGKQFLVPSQDALGGINAAVKAILPFPVVAADGSNFPTSLIRADRNDWSPRIGIAYRLMKDSVLRVGFGAYHSPLVSTGNQLSSGLFAVNESFPDAQPTTPLLTIKSPFQTAGKSSAAVSFVSPEADLKTPLHYSWNVAFERQFRDNAFTVEYSAKKSVVPWQHNINALPPSTTPYSASRLPFPTLGGVTQLSNGAHYNYKALRLNAKRRMANGLFFDIAYLFSKTVDDIGGITGEIAGSSEDPFNRNRDRGESYFMPPHRMTVNWVYQVPFGKKGGKLSFGDSNPAGKLANLIIQGWELAGTYNFQESAPLNVSGLYLNAAGKNYDAPNTNRFSGRPNCTGASFDPPSGYVFNPAAFDNHVAPGTYGTCGRGILRYGAGTILMNQAFYRNFRIPWFVNREQGATFRFGFQMFNFPNHSNVPSPSTDMSSAFFGKRATDRTGNIRTMLFQARITF